MKRKKYRDKCPYCLVNYPLDWSRYRTKNEVVREREKAGKVHWGAHDNGGFCGIADYDQPTRLLWFSYVVDRRDLLVVLESVAVCTAKKWVLSYRMEIVI